MSAGYATDRADALEMIREAGSTVTFPGAIAGAPAVYDPATDTYSGGTPPTDAFSHAVQIEGDPDRFRALSLVLTDPVTLFVAATFTDVAGVAVAFTPTIGGPMTWAGVTYTVQDREPVAPDGVPIVWTLTGSR